MKSNKMESLKNFLIIIEYDGSRFHGWQRQKEERTVSGEIEKALSKIAGRRIPVKGSGRTDAGVHAFGHAASFRLVTKLDADVFKKALNSILSNDIVIRKCVEVPEAFHAQYDAVGKEYHYWIGVKPDKCALFRKNAWVVKSIPDVDAMQTAAKSIVGTHDFKAFEGAGSPRSDTVRTIQQAEFVQYAKGELPNPMGMMDLIVFKIRGNGFLRYMVRNIMGTLMDVGGHMMTVEEFSLVLQSKDRSRAGKTAPAHGLYLMRVEYSDESFKQPYGA